MQVQDLLKSKGSEVVSTGSDTPLGSAARLLTQHRIGALVVTDQRGQLCGIFSERDVARSLAAHGAQLPDMRVDEAMTHEVVTCKPVDDVESLMARMTERRCRHLPVVQGGVLCGIISIGDLVKCRLQELEAEKHDLQAYITRAGVNEQRSQLN